MKAQDLNRWERFVHQRSDGRWVVAWWDSNHYQYIQPLPEKTARLTGCFACCSRSVDGLSFWIYKSKLSALKKAKYLYG